MGIGFVEKAGGIKFDHLNMCASKTTVWILLSVLFGSWDAASAIPTGRPEENPKTTWLVLQDALEHGDFTVATMCVGKTVVFEANVIDPFVDKVLWLRPNPLRAKIYRKVPSSSDVVDTGIICRIALLPSEIKPVAGFGAASIGVSVLGKVTRFDTGSKTVEVSSEKTEVDWAD